MIVTCNIVQINQSNYNDTYYMFSPFVCRFIYNINLISPEQEVVCNKLNSCKRTDLTFIYVESYIVTLIVYSFFCWIMERNMFRFKFSCLFCLVAIKSKKNILIEHFFGILWKIKVEHLKSVHITFIKAQSCSTVYIDKAIPKNSSIRYLAILLGLRLIDSYY